MDYIVEKLDNRLDDIRCIYESNVVTDDFTRDCLCTREFFDRYVSQKEIEPHSRTSSYIRTSERAGRWHVDGNPFLICTYPNPTQVLIPAAEVDLSYLISCDYTAHPRATERLIKSGAVKVVTLGLGDVYYVGRHTIHRTNPQAYASDANHLVLRMLNPTLGTR